LPSGVTACYNGNIAANTWTYNGSVKGYYYTYDELNRLKSGSTYQNADIGNSYGANETFWYDKMGNITYLNRSKVGSSQNIDALSMQYKGNQVTKVWDDAGSQNSYTIKEYQNKSNATIEMTYDANGNQIKDLDRDIVTIRYNLLNLPEYIQFGNGNVIKNLYDAGGQKLRSDYYTRFTSLATPITDGQVLEPVYSPTDYGYSGMAYIGNIEYGINKVPVNLYSYVYVYNDVLALQEIYNTEGYVENLGSFNYYYFRKDHLGNNREVWQAPLSGGTGAGITVQRTQYYPSGLPWAEGLGADMQNRKYNGKEFVEMSGYDMYDYGARFYYPALPTLPTVDPLAEKKPWISPYVYCLNNPVRFTDPDGREVDIEHRTGFLGLGKKETLKYDNGKLYNKDGSAYAGKVNGFLKKTVNALGSLNQTKEGASMVTELQSSSNVFTIKSGAESYFKADSPSKAGANLTEVQAATGNTAGSTGSGGTIFWNSSSTSGGLDLSGGTERPAFIGLGHEMGHASDSNQGLLHYGGMDNNGNVNPSSYTNVSTGFTYNFEYNGLLKSEWRAVYRENLIRGQAGIPLRTYYGYDITTGSPLPTGPRLLDSTNQPLNYP